VIYTANSVLLFRKSAEVCRKIYISTKLKRVLSVAYSVGFVASNQSVLALGKALHLGEWSLG